MKDTVFVLGLVVALVIVSIFTRLLGWKRLDPWVRNLEHAQNIMLIIASILAGIWFFYERPHSARIKLDQNVSAIAISGKKSNEALIVAEVVLTNIGQSALDLRNENYRGFVQQVTPLPAEVKGENDSDRRGGYAKIHEGDRWGSIAEIQQKLPTFLEAGETENLYYRVTINCKKYLRVYYTSYVDKKPMFGGGFILKADKLSWVKQTLVDLSKICNT